MQEECHALANGRAEVLAELSFRGQQSGRKHGRRENRPPPEGFQRGAESGFQPIGDFDAESGMGVEHQSGVTASNEDAGLRCFRTSREGVEDGVDELAAHRALFDGAEKEPRHAAPVHFGDRLIRERSGREDDVGRGLLAAAPEGLSDCVAAVAGTDDGDPFGIDVRSRFDPSQGDVDVPVGSFEKLPLLGIRFFEPPEVHALAVRAQIEAERRDAPRRKRLRNASYPLDFDRDFEFPVHRVNVRHPMFSVEHADHDAKEAGEFGHL